MAWVSIGLRPTARRVLVGRVRARGRPEAGRFTRTEVDRIVEATSTGLPGVLRDRPRERTLGARQSVLLAGLTVAFFRALLDAGIEREYAIELTGDVAWRTVAHPARLVKALTAHLGGTPVQRLQRRLDLIMRFPFGRPSFDFEDREEPRGRAFDMRRCPIAEYMASHGAADLCVGSWCNADFALAEMWGGRLERRGTLAAGATQCDFCFVTASEPMPRAPRRRPLPSDGPDGA